MSENEKSKNGWGILIFTVLLVFILWGLNWFLLWLYGGESDKRGQFGDMFGAVNALFSGLAFSFLIYTIWIQREELTLQREELKLQREALQLQVEELKRQADELERTGLLQKQSLEIQKLQMKLAEEQTEEERNRTEKQNKPRFVSNGTFNGFYNRETANLRLQLTNVGGSASNLIVGDIPSCKESGKKFSYLEKDKYFILNWDIQDIENYPAEVEIQLAFNDIFGKNHTQSFRMLNDKTKISESNKFKIIQN